MINYISTDIPKKSLKKVGRKIVLELFENNKILSKYQIFNKYLYLNSMEAISDDFKAKYKLIEARLCDTKVENIYQNVKNSVFHFLIFTFFRQNVLNFDRILTEL